MTDSANVAAVELWSLPLEGSRIVLRARHATALARMIEHLPLDSKVGLHEADGVIHVEIEGRSAHFQIDRYGQVRRIDDGG